MCGTTSRRAAEAIVGSTPPSVAARLVVDQADDGPEHLPDALTDLVVVS